MSNPFFKLLVVSGSLILSVGGIATVIMHSSSKNKKEEELYLPSLELSFDKVSFAKAFNKPGDCILRPFKNVTRRIRQKKGEIYKLNVFEKPSNLVKSSFKKAFSQEIKPIDIFDPEGTDNVPPDFGCFMLNKPKKNEFRLEISLIRGNRGWIWMGGINKLNNFYFREIAVGKTNKGNWKAMAANDGYYTDSLTNTFPQFNPKHFPISPKSVENNKICDYDNYCETEAIGALWIPDIRSHTSFLNFSNNIEKSVIAFSSVSTTSDNRNTKGKRHYIYLDSTWFTDDNTGKKEIITFKKDKIVGSHTKGYWKDLIEFCKSKVNSEHPAYRAFCR